MPDWAARSGVQRVQRILRGHVLPLDVVQDPIGSLSDHRIPEIPRLIPLNHPCDGRIAHDAHAVSVGNQDRGFKHTAFLDPMCSGHVTVTIAGKEAGEDSGLAVLPTWQYCGDASTNRPFANDKFALSRN
jgi:hypothetical protein